MTLVASYLQRGMGMSTTIQYGAKFEAGLDTAQIAARVRVDIAAAVKAGELPKAKYSVRISRFSGGSSIDITVRALPFQVLNRASYKLASYGLEQVGPWMSDEARAVDAKLEAMLAAYNFDGSDLSTDYFHVRFYGHVTIDTTGAYEALRAELEAAAAPATLDLVALSLFEAAANDVTPAPYCSATTGW